MAKVDLTQKILGFDGEPVILEVGYEGSQIIQKCGNVISKKMGKDSLQKFFEGLKDEFSVSKTLKDVMLTALMVSDQGMDGEQKLEQYKLLQQVASGDEVDLGVTEREKIFKKIQQHYNHIMVVGRSKEMLIDAFEEVGSKTKK